MKKSLATLILATMLICLKSSAQTYTLYSDKTFGGRGVENHVSLGYYGNGQLVLVGESTTYANGDKTDPLCTLNKSDVWVLKIDTAYNILWNKSIGGNQYDMYPNFTLASNGNLVFSCATVSDSSCENSNAYLSPNLGFDYWVYSMDLNGNKIWDKRLGGGGADYFPDIAMLASGNLIVTGTSISAPGGNKTATNYGNEDYWAVLLNNTGNISGDFVYGGYDEEMATYNVMGAYTSLISVIPDKGNSFVLAGTTNSGIGGSVSSSGFGDIDLWIIKVDSSGNKIWDRTFGGNFVEGLADIVKTNDGYILTGHTNSLQGGSVSQPRIGSTDYDIWVVKLDTLGNKVWDRRFGGVSHDIGSSVAVAPNGGYWVLGSTLSPPSAYITEPPYGNSDYWIFKIDNLGNKTWDKRFGGPGADRASNFVIMPDTSIYICGHATTGNSLVKADSGKGLTDYWLVHFKYDDNITSVKSIDNFKDLISLYPVPATENLEVVSHSLSVQEIEVSNTFGEIVLQQFIQNKNKFSVNIASLKKGIYYVKIKGSKRNRVMKFIKV